MRDEGDAPLSWGMPPARLQDVVDLIQRAMDPAWSRAQIESALANPTLRLLTTLEEETETLSGLVLAQRVAADLVEIELVGVDPRWRRRGIGRRLLEELIWAEGRDGVDEFRLELAESNAAARSLYEAVGFVVVGRRARYYPDGDDALLLSRQAPAAETASDERPRRDD